MAVLDDKLQGNLRVIDVLSRCLPFCFPSSEELRQFIDRHIVDCVQLDSPIYGENPIDLAVLPDDRGIQVVVSCEAPDSLDVQRFDLILTASFVDGVITFATPEHGQSGDKSELQVLTTIILEYIRNAMLDRKILQEAKMWEDSIEIGFVSMMLEGWNLAFASGHWKE